MTPWIEILLLDVWTNEINTSDKVSSIWISVGAVPTTIKTKSFTFDALNYDICAGGILPVSVPNIGLPWWGNIINFAEWFGNTLNNHGRENICHSPLFSTTASTENITTQAQLNRSIQSIQSNGFTPFDDIYSGTVHTTHTNSNNILTVWEKPPLAQQVIPKKELLVSCCAATRILKLPLAT